MCDTSSVPVDGNKPQSVAERERIQFKLLLTLTYEALKSVQLYNIELYNCTLFNL